MRPKLLFNLGRALAACLLASCAAAAQEQPPTSAGAGRLVVQVEYFEGAQPAYSPVPGGGWFGHFAPTGPPQMRSTAETPRAVDVKTRAVEGGRVEITVGVHLGVTHFDRFEEVGKYYAAAGERVTALGLRRFGVVPFRFRVLRVSDAAAAPPTVVNMTQSVEAVVTDFTPTPLPRGKLTLRNLSPKRVRAVYVREMVGGRNRGMGYVALREGRTLMEPGGTAEKPFVARTGQTSDADFTPAAVESIVVVGVVFEDYTYEGEVEQAALKRAFAEGERAQLPRLMALVREAQAAPDVESAAALRRLRESLSALSSDAPRWAVDAVEGNYPGLEFTGPGRWKSAVEISMHGVRREMLDDLERFEKKFQASPAENSFKRWLKETQTRFEGWLSRL
jgi:hypothetical protein